MPSCGWSARPATGAPPRNRTAPPSPSCVSTGPPRLSVNVLDDLDEFIHAEAVLACVVNEFAGLLNDLSAFGNPDHGDAAAAAEFEEPFVAQEPKGPEDSVGVHAQYRGQVLGGRKALPRLRLTLRNGTPDLHGDLLEEVGGVILVHLDCQHGASKISIILGKQEAGMTVTDGPRTLRPQEPFENTEAPVVLIPEARQRALRRRRWYAFAALIALVAASLAFFGRPGPPPDLTPLGDPAVEGPSVAAGQGKPASIIAHHGIFHFGWILVYDDGRVIEAKEVEPMQRRLSGKGLELVRSGGIHPGSLMIKPPSGLPDGIWVDAEAREYIPSAYAACFDPPGLSQDGMGPALADLRELQRGRERTYPDVDILSRQFDPSPGPFDCFEVKAQEIPEAFAAIRAAGFPGFDELDLSQQGCVEFRLGVPVLCFHAVLPHGSWVLWGG